METRPDYRAPSLPFISSFPFPSFPSHRRFSLRFSLFFSFTRLASANTWQPAEKSLRLGRTIEILFALVRRPRWCTPNQRTLFSFLSFFFIFFPFPLYFSPVVSFFFFTFLFFFIPPPPFFFFFFFVWVNTGMPQRGFPSGLKNIVLAPYKVIRLMLRNRRPSVDFSMEILLHRTKGKNGAGFVSRDTYSDTKRHQARCSRGNCEPKKKNGRKCSTYTSVCRCTLFPLFCSCAGVNWYHLRVTI